MIAAAFGCLIAWPGAHTATAAVIKKANNATSLNIGGSWVGGKVPLSGDIALWDSTVTAANSVSLNASLSWAGIQLANPGGPVTINGSDTLTLGGSGIDMTGAANNLTINSSIALGGGQTWDVASSRTLAVGGNIDNGNRLLTVQGLGDTTIAGIIGFRTTKTGALTKNGGGTLTLTGANAYTGGTTIGGGVLSVGAIADTGTSNLSTSKVTLSGGTLRYTGTAAASTSRSFEAAGAGGAINVSKPAAMLTINSGVLGSLTAPVAKQGPGKLVLAGTADNGAFVLEAAEGTTELAKTAAGGTRAVAGIGNTAAGATVRLTGPSGDQIYGGTSSGAAALVNMGGGTLDFNGKSEGWDRLAGTGTITNAATGTASTLTLGEAGGSSAFAGTIQDGAGTMALVKTGPGTLALTGSNSHNGGTTVSAGTLVVNNLPGAGPISVRGNGTLQLDPGGGNTIALSAASSVTNDGLLHVRSGTADFGSRAIESQSLVTTHQPLDSLAATWCKPSDVNRSGNAFYTGGGDTFITFTNADTFATP